MNSIKINKQQIILLILLMFLGIGALGGGIALILSPSGKLIGMPLSILATSPFNSFLIPGIILFVILGVLPCILVRSLIIKRRNKTLENINLFKDMHWAWTYSIYTAFALIIWIQLEMEFIQAVHWLHTFYIFLALAIIYVALLPQVRIVYKKNFYTKNV